MKKLFAAISIWYMVVIKDAPEYFILLLLIFLLIVLSLFLGQLLWEDNKAFSRMTREIPGYLNSVMREVNK